MQIFCFVTKQYSVVTAEAGDKQAYHVSHWPCVYDLVALAGDRLRV